MKKKLWLGLWIIVLSVCMTGCARNKAEMFLEEETGENLYPEVLEITASLVKASSTGMVIYVENADEEHEFQFSRIILEEYVDGEWRKLEPIHEITADQNAIYRGIESGSKVKCEIDWEYEYGSLPSGEYRLSCSCERLLI